MHACIANYCVLAYVAAYIPVYTGICIHNLHLCVVYGMPSCV